MLLLDVDGVLNGRKSGWGREPRTVEVWSSTSDRHYTLRYEPRTLAAIRDLASSGRVEIRWCTTWVPDVGNVEAALGLPSFPIAFPADVVGGGGLVWAAKFGAALNVVREGRPLIWVDDDIDPSDVAIEDMEGVPTLFIAPDYQGALRPHHIQFIRDFVGLGVSPEWKPKGLREALCHQATFAPDDRTRQAIQSLVDVLDLHRPLGSDGKHGDRHTPTCGCET